MIGPCDLLNYHRSIPSCIIPIWKPNRKYNNCLGLKDHLKDSIKVYHLSQYVYTNKPQISNVASQFSSKNSGLQHKKLVLNLEQNRRALHSMRTPCPFQLALMHFPLPCPFSANGGHPVLCLLMSSRPCPF